MERKVKLRNEVDKKYQWDLSKMIESKEKFEELYNKILSLVEEIKKLKGNIIDSSETLFSYVKMSDELDRNLDAL